MWSSELNKVPQVAKHKKNPHHWYAIAAFKQRPRFFGEQVVGHLQKFMGSCTINIITVRRGVVTARVLDVKHWRSPLVQRGLEIPVKVTVVLKQNDENKQAIAIFYETSVNKHYKEPVDRD